ncbi:MarR family winged helix-turn-helix transcriptional regulator [Oricola sp.]|uniref:MarR family winged helix-turn-helix transcriptional regulator n=1 Tax=Oricola sp. TaxID=1979950 RepID=UPI00320BEC1B|nr:MarR family transcriptional regulator [Oricola sp.]
MDFNKAESAGYLANHMARLFANALHERIRPLGLAPAQFMTLLELWEEDGRTQKDLVRRLDIEQATMANTLKRMERDGLIIRQENPKDRRAQLIRLTDKARSLQDDATAAANEVNGIALSGLSEEERRAFIKTMTRVIGALQG